MEKATVYFTKEINSNGLMKAYHALGKKLNGKVAIKISTGEPGGHNFFATEINPTIGIRIKWYNRRV